MIPKIVKRSAKKVELSGGDIALEIRYADSDLMGDLFDWMAKYELTVDDVFIDHYYDSCPIGELAISALIFHSNKAKTLLHLLY